MPEPAQPAGPALRPRLLVAGYYGYGNIGDEAILQALLHDLGRELPGARFSVLYGGGNAASAAIPETNAAELAGRVRYLPRLQPAAIEAAMRDSDLLVLGGGTLIQDTTSLRSLVYYLSLIWSARRHGLPVVIYGGGIGPLTTAAGRWLCRLVLPGVSLMALRDRRSFELARELGVPERRLLLTADPAFSTAASGASCRRGLDSPPACLPKPASLPAGGMCAGQPLSSAVDAALSAAGLPSDRAAQLLVLALRPPLEAADREAICAAVRAVAPAASLLPLLVPFHPEQDLPLLEQVGAGLGLEHLVLRGVRDPAVLRGIVSRARLVLAMRLHGLIFAVGAGVPAVALAYDPKVDALADDVPALRYARYPRVSEGELEGRMQDVLAAGDALRLELSVCAARLAARGAVNAAAVRELLEAGRTP